MGIGACERKKEPILGVDVCSACGRADCTLWLDMKARKEMKMSEDPKLWKQSTSEGLNFFTDPPGLGGDPYKGELFKHLRDERRFRAACAAMQGRCAHPESTSWAYERIADFSVKMADALIKRLEEE